VQPSKFPTTGIAIIGWSLASYAIGVAAGCLWRRALPALATIVVASSLGVAASKLRLHYLAPLITKSLALAVALVSFAQAVLKVVTTLHQLIADGGRLNTPVLMREHDPRGPTTNSAGGSTGVEPPRSNQLSSSTQGRR